MLGTDAEVSGGPCPQEVERSFEIVVLTCGGGTEDTTLGGCISFHFQSLVLFPPSTSVLCCFILSD